MRLQLARVPRFGPFTTPAEKREAAILAGGRIIQPSTTPHLEDDLWEFPGGGLRWIRRQRASHVR